VIPANLRGLRGRIREGHFDYILKPRHAARLARLYALDRLDVDYRFPGIYDGLEGNRTVAGSTLTLELRPTIPNAPIRYTLDGSVPNATSALYTGPLRIPLGPDGVSVIARVILDARHVSPPQAATFRPAAP
jgi:hexosaminidase